MNVAANPDYYARDLPPAPPVLRKCPHCRRTDYGRHHVPLREPSHHLGCCPRVCGRSVQSPA